MVVSKGICCCAFLLLIQLVTYVAPQGPTQCPEQCPTWPHLCAMVREGSNPQVTRQCITYEEAELLRQATQGAGGMGASTGGSGPSVPNFLQPGSFSPTGPGPRMPGVSSVQPGIPGGDPLGTLFPGASSLSGQSQSGIGRLSTGFSDTGITGASSGRTGGLFPGSSRSGLMGARPLSEPPRGAGSMLQGQSFPGSAGSIPGSLSPLTDPMSGGGPTAGGVPSQGDTTGQPQGEASVIMSDDTGTYYNFYAYVGSAPIRVNITKIGFCQMRTPESPGCYEGCNSDSVCPGAQKCCPVGCSLECGDPRPDTP